MKSLLIARYLVTISLLYVFLSSCKKEDTPPVAAVRQNVQENKIYKDYISGSWSGARAKRDALYSGSWTSYYQVEASGNSSVMENIYTLICFSTTSGNNGTVNSGASISKAWGDKLTEIGHGIIPTTVSQIVYDDNGNSIWFEIVSLDFANTNSTHRSFSGFSRIIGGTGKFAAASGTVKVTGQMDVFGIDVFTMRNDGNITY